MALIKEDGTFHDVYRVDTCHGFLHEQKFWQSKRKIILEGDSDIMFHIKSKEVKENYVRWVELFRKKRGII